MSFKSSLWKAFLSAQSLTESLGENTTTYNIIIREKPPGGDEKTSTGGIYEVPREFLPPYSQVRSGGVELTVTELEAMAVRQQEEMANQRQLLAVKEQRLRYLKEHEVRHAQVAHETDRLRRLRDRVEAQELKLTKLRALRGQLDHNKSNNHTLIELIFSTKLVGIFSDDPDSLCQVCVERLNTSMFWAAQLSRIDEILSLQPLFQRNVDEECC
ncbi:hypothetical protein GE061_019552 [Apolygus lucorum]|uniref:Uncharacterized protein n=1 Tax=Apolygus lucorum TaxID=248454 RepID=A0A8S9XAP3_APOLU|nr:hypothetical protein GE061_019552 [Apolygus lucorum]